MQSEELVYNLVIIKSLVNLTGGGRFFTVVPK